MWHRPASPARRSLPLLRRTVTLGVALLIASLLGCATVPAAGPARHITLLPTSRPYLVLLCKASDIPTVPHDLAYYQKLFTENTPSLRNVYKYFLDESYGTIDIAGTVIKDWLPTTSSTADLLALRPPDHPNWWRTPLSQRCADAYHGLVKFSDFAAGGVITIWNLEGADGGQTGGITEDGKGYPSVNAGAGTEWYENSVSFFTHEMLHTMGLNHAHGPAPSSPPPEPLRNEIDLGDDHVFGSLRWWDYGDCWTIMGCGYWVAPNADFAGSAFGPDLGAVQKDVLGWVPKSRIVTYDRSTTKTVTLAPANEPSMSGNLLIKIPVSGAGYYTVEFASNSGWSAAVPIKQAVLIHEQYTADLSSPVLIGRTIYGAWFPGQVFRDTANHLRISIDAFGDAATVTLSPDGPGDGGAFTCAPAGYVPQPGTPGYSPTIAFVLPTPSDPTYVTGVPVKLVARASDPVIAPTPVADDHILWQVDGTPAGTGSTFTRAFAKPGDYIIKVQVLGRSCLSVDTSIVIHVVSGASARPTPPPASAKLSVSPTQTVGYCVNGQYPALSVANAGTAPLQWSVSGPQEVTISPHSGSLAPNQQAQTLTLTGAYPGHTTLVLSFSSNGGTQQVTITCH